ncbi:MAG TPA: sodium-dependent transporter [Actinomycetales bacterium]|nr:sodium-dependent transporter [Actinomycetales bacterium]
MSAAADTQVRDRWGSKAGFILAAMGSAIGLGNIWRFPYVVYENGGGAFLIPYFIAIATAALPILILEYALGHKYQTGAPFAFRGIRKAWESLGWFQVLVSFVIATYYTVILGWCLSYIVFSFGRQWGDDTEGFFISKYLGTSADGDPSGFWDVGGLRLDVLLPVLVAWGLIFWILKRGVSRGIELASKVLMPALIIMLVIIVVRAVTLDGAMTGLNVLFTPDFGALSDPGVWIAAYGQVFFSMSIAFSIMIAYSSYLPRKTDLANSGAIVGLSNAGFEFLAAIGVFGVLGFLAAAQGAEVTEVAGNGGIGLAFIAFPQIINTLPGLNAVFGVLFFGTLFFAGLTSAVSILECVIAAVREKFGASRTTAVSVVVGAAALVSLLYVTRGGLFYLDTVDHFFNNFGLVISGLLEVILVAWIARQLGPLRDHVNATSYLRVGTGWTISLAVITPVLLLVMTLYNLWNEIREPYEGYPRSGLLALGWLLVLAAVVLAFLASRIRDRGPAWLAAGSTSPAAEME